VEKKALRATATGNYGWSKEFGDVETVGVTVDLSGDIAVAYALPIDNLEDGSWTLEFNPTVNVGGT
jgi:hypothetical protein